MKEKDYIIKSFKHYQDTGDMRLLLYDLRMLACNISSKHGCLKDFAHDQLWSHILERIAVGIKHYDAKKGNPFQFFYGLIKKHVFYYACRKGRKPEAILFDSMMAMMPPFSCNLNNEIELIHDQHEADVLLNRHSNNDNKIVDAFMDQVKDAITDGEDILKIKHRMIKHKKLSEKEIEQIDLRIVMMRKMQWKILNT